MRLKGGKEGKGRRRARPELQRCTTGQSRGKERGGRREREAPTGGAPVSVAAGKKEKKTARTRAVREKPRWAGGPLG
jgi:hypothetical protein